MAWRTGERNERPVRLLWSNGTIYRSSRVRAESLRRRTAQRWLAEEEEKQRNMEAITTAALHLINDTAKPDEMARDWLVNFCDKSPLTSHEEMQRLWAAIIAGR